MRWLCRVPPSQACLTRTSQSDSNASGAGRHHGPAPPCAFTASLIPPAPLSAPDRHFPLPTANTPPPGPPTGTDPRPTGVTLRSCRLQSQPRVRRDSGHRGGQTGSDSGLENPLAGDAFWMLGSPISHGGDHGAACHHEPESGAKNLGQVAGFYRAEGWGREGYPIGR